MFVLGIDTATDVGTVAVVENLLLRGEVKINQRFAQSRSLVDAIDFLFRSLQLKKSDLHGIAVSIGPGSYTGLRIGLSVGKALAFSWELPLLAVNSLDALAQLGREQKGWVCSLIRFRRQEYYHALYFWDGMEMKRRSDYRVARLTTILTELKSDTRLVGVLHEDDREFLAQEEAPPKHHFLPDVYPSAFWTAMLGMKDLQMGVKENIHTITPFYMHDFPIKG